MKTRSKTDGGTAFFVVAGDKVLPIYSDGQDADGKRLLTIDQAGERSRRDRSELEKEWNAFHQSMHIAKTSKLNRGDVAPSIIVPGMRIFDMEGPGEPYEGVVISTAKNGVAYRVDGGIDSQGSIGEIWIADWDCVAICPRQTAPDSQPQQIDKPISPEVISDAWAEAIASPAVRERLEFFANSRGEIDHATLLLAIVDRWDMASEKDKYDSLQSSMKFVPTEEGAFYEGKFHKSR